MKSLLNQKAPNFELNDQNGVKHSISDYQGSYVLLYFYPKDMTPGCTVEACAFRDKFVDLKKAGVVVLGVSTDNLDSHKKFAEKEHLNFPILSDENREVVEKYGVWQEKLMFGKKREGTLRNSFLISPMGIVIKHYEKVKPENHAEEVLQDVLTM